MYAIKKHINKVMAVFLCACLLLSYNPAFGAVETAFADVTKPDLKGSLSPSQGEVDAGVTGASDMTADGFGNWNAGTDVIVSTFDSDLKTDATQTVYGTRAQITAKDPNPIIVEATCASGKSFADYVFKWTVKKDGVALDDAAQQRLAQAADKYVSGQLPWDDDRKVARSVIDLRPLFANDDQNYVNNAKYEFVCEVSLKADPSKTATETIVVYTVDENNHEAEYAKDRLESADTPFVVATGKFLDSASLKTEMATGTEGVGTAISNLLSNMQTDDVSYGNGPIYQINVTGGMTIEDVQIPPYDNDGYTLWFPIDDAYVYDEANNNRQGYQEGEEITVLWKGNLASATNTIQEVKATVVKDPKTGKLMAELVYDAVNHTVTGKDGAKWTAAADWMEHPGFFSVVLPSNKTKPGEGDVTYYTVNATVNGTGGTIPVSPGKVRTGTDAEFDIVPDVTDTMRYKLKALMYTAPGASSAINLLGSGVSIPTGITIDAARSHVKVGAPLNDQENYDRVYTFVAEFELATTDTSPTNQTTFKLNMNVVDENGNSSDRAVISAEYTKKGETALVTVDTANASNSASVDVLSTGQANLSFMAHAPENGKTYGVKKVETSTDGVNWETASLAGGKLNIPYMDKNMYVKVTAGEVENTTLPTYFNVTVVAGSGGSVSPTQGIVAVNPTSISSMAVVMTGDSGFYPSAVKVKEGTAAEKPYAYTNADKKQADTLTYTPSSANLDGDVVITVEFAPVSVSCTLTTTVTTKDKNNSTTSAVGGTISPSWNNAGVSPFTVVAGNTYPFMIVADENYSLTSVEVYENGALKEDKSEEVKRLGGALPFVPNANSEIRVTFTEKADALKPGDPSNPNKDKTWAVNAYVADSSLKDIDAFQKYTNLNWSEQVNGKSIDVASYKNSRGSITSGTSASVLDGSSFPLTFKPAAAQVDGTYSKVEKVLVIGYTEDTSGNKTVTSRNVIETGMLSYVLTNITGAKDVIVYFTADETATGPTVGENDYKTVTVTNSNPTAGSVTPLGPQQVVNGGSLGLSFVPNAGYELSSVIVSPAPGSTTGSQTYTPDEYLLLSGIQAGTTVTVNWTKLPDPTKESHYVKLASGVTNGTVAVNTSNIVTAAGYPVEEATAGAGLPSFDLTWTAASGYTLQSETITWDDNTVFAYVSAPNGVPQIRFTKTDAAVLSGEAKYNKGTVLTVNGSTTPAAKWTVLAGLPCDITVGGTFVQTTTPTPTDEYWTVTTKLAGSVAGGTITPSGQNNVVKDSAAANNYRIDFPAAEGFKIKHVTVKHETGNALVDFWEGLVGFISGSSTAASMEAQAISQGYVIIKKVDANYEITVEYEADENLIPPDDPLLDMLPVNVIFNKDQGDVQPNQSVIIKKDVGTQQFVVSPGLDAENNLYRLIEKVIVDGQDVPRGTNAHGITWDTTYNNVFTLSAAGKTQAITVEVIFSEQGKLDPSGSGSTPGTPTPEELRNVVVNVTSDGVSVEGDGGVGGLVAPRGPFTVVKNATPQMVVVAPSADYTLDSITVSGGASGETGAAFAADVAAQGYFSIAAADGKMGDLTITVNFKQKPMDQRFYTITPSVQGGNGSITPDIPVTLETDRDYTFFVEPDTIGYCVSVIKDQYKDASGNLVDVPGGLSFDRASATGTDKTKAIHLLKVTPIKVGGKVVDRQLTITFAPVGDFGIPGGDHVTDPGDLVNLRVSVFGTSEAGIINTSPTAGTMRVYKGTTADPASYLYSFWMSEKGVRDGYRIYRVMMNGKDVYGSASATTGTSQGTFEFTTANMTRSTNVLSVYVKKFDGSTINPGGNVDVEIGWGSGGTVDFGSKRTLTNVTKKAANDMATDDRLSNWANSQTITVSAEGPFELPTIIPEPGKVIKKVYLYNCSVHDFSWINPEDPESDTHKTALNYWLELGPDALTNPARVFITFQDGDQNTFEGWDYDVIDDPDQYMLNSNLILNLVADDSTGIETLAGKDDSGKVQVHNLVNVANPDAPMRPTISGSGASYRLTYNTLKNDNVEFVVGDLIKLNEDDPKNSTIYTVDKVEFSDGSLVSVEPIEPKGKTALAAEGDADEFDNAKAGEDSTEQKPKYYKQYLVKGTTAKVDPSQDNPDRKATATVTLKKLSAADGEFPEFPTINGNTPDNPDDPNKPDNPDDPNNPNKPDDPNKPDNPDDNKTYYTVSTSVTPEDCGKITPTSTTPSTAWNGSNETGPWKVASGTSVSFKIEPADGYVLSALSYGNTNALLNGTYNANTRTLTFSVRSNVEVKATFAKQGSAESMRTITIEVQGGHGTTSPAPNKYQVEKGKSYPITFKADTGYVPYRIWVDGVQSYVSPTLSGWMLPASWSDQTFKVQFALAGTTPTTGDYLNQTGQNLANQAGTALTQTGDNPWAVATLVLVVAGAVFAVVALRRRKATAERAAKYSVTRRK